jgi:hypothetical protein
MAAVEQLISDIGAKHWPTEYPQAERHSRKCFAPARPTQGAIQRFAIALCCFVLLGLTGGCASQQQFLSQIEPTALSAVQSRAQFELNCPSVNTSILSSKIIQPIAPFAGGIQRAEYTVGVEGCGRRSVYMAVCPDSNNCNAFAQTGRVLEELN